MLSWLVLVLAFQGGGRSVVETHPAEQVLQLHGLPVPGSVHLTVQGGLVERFRVAGATVTLDAPVRRGDIAIVSYISADLSPCAAALQDLQPEERTASLHCPSVTHWATGQSNCISVWDRQSGRRQVCCAAGRSGDGVSRWRPGSRLH